MVEEVTGLVGKQTLGGQFFVINQEVEIYDALLDASATVSHSLAPGRKSWVQVVRGAVDVNGRIANAGDGAAVEDENNLTVTSRQNGSEILLFDLP